MFSAERMETVYLEQKHPNKSIDELLAVGARFEKYISAGYDTGYYVAMLDRTNVARVYLPSDPEYDRAKQLVAKLH